MEALALRVRAEEAEEALDGLLPLTPGGIYERALGHLVELTLVPGRHGIPSRDAAAAAAGRGLVALGPRELPDDLAERVGRLVHAPIVGGRFVIRSPAAPPPEDPGLEDIVIDRGNAFGTGLHPTTRRCLELMLALEPAGSFADLGCGTGVLGIAASRLGWAPVVAVDHDEASVEAARANAASNGVALEARRVDLLTEPAPTAATVVANVPPFVHESVVAGLPETPRALIVSGVSPEEADSVVALYCQRALVERRRLVESGWAAVLLTARDVAIPAEPPSDVAPRMRVRVPAAGAAADPSSAPRAAAPPALGLPGQLETTLEDGTFALSTTRELETGARVALILVPGLFRLDVAHLEDTLRTSVRNLSGEPVRLLPDGGSPRTVLTTESEWLPRPVITNSRILIRAGTGSGTRDATVTLSALSGSEPGRSRVVAQALVSPGRS